MRTLPLFLAVAALAVAGCGDDDGDNGSKEASADATMEKKEDVAMKKDEPAMDKTGTSITLRDSDFGPMLFNSNRQAIYVFERDGRNKTVCYGECADAWPPVFTDAAPRAAKGVNEALLGTIKRRDGRRQVTYAGKPLYFYAHEDPGQVLCHNVNLNGGLWWAVGADGKPRPA